MVNISFRPRIALTSDSGFLPTLRKYRRRKEGRFIRVRGGWLARWYRIRTRFVSCPG